MPRNVVDPNVASLKKALFPRTVVALATVKIPVPAKRFVADAAKNVDEEAKRLSKLPIVAKKLVDDAFTSVEEVAKRFVVVAFTAKRFVVVA